MTDREFAILIRRMLLAIVAKIEQRYGLGRHADAQEVEVKAEDSMSVLV